MYKYLVDLYIGDTVKHFAEEAGIYKVNQNDTYYLQGLSNINISYTLGNEGKKDISFSILSGELDIPYLVSKGHNPMSWKAKVIGYNNEADLTLSREIAFGDLDCDGFGTKNNETTFRFREQQSSIKNIFSNSAVINSETFPRDISILPEDDPVGSTIAAYIDKMEIPSTSEGVIYPFYFGTPGGGFGLKELLNVLNQQDALVDNKTFVKIGTFWINKIYPVECLPIYEDVRGHNNTEPDGIIDRWDVDANLQTAIPLQTALICLDYLRDDCDFKIVNVKTREEITSDRITRFNTFDSLGNRVTLVSFKQTTEYDQDLALDPTAEYLISFNSPVSEINGFGDFLLYLSEKSYIFDRKMLLSEKALLNKIKISGVIKENKTIDEILSDVTNNLPVIKVIGKHGIFYRLDSYDFKASEVKSILTNKISCTRESNVRFSSSNEIFNSFTIKYCKGLDFNTLEDKYYATTTFSSLKDDFDINIENKNFFNGISTYDKALLSDKAIIESYYNVKNTDCSKSERIYGKKDLLVEYDYIYSDGMIDVLASHLINKFSKPRKSISYKVPLTMDIFLPGDFILLNDDELYFTEKKCKINNVNIGSTDIILDLEILD